MSALTPETSYLEPELAQGERFMELFNCLVKELEDNNIEVLGESRKAHFEIVLSEDDENYWCDINIGDRNVLTRSFPKDNQEEEETIAQAIESSSHEGSSVVGEIEPSKSVLRIDLLGNYSLKGAPRYAVRYNIELLEGVTTNAMTVGRGRVDLVKENGRWRSDNVGSPAIRINDKLERATDILELTSDDGDKEVEQKEPVEEVVDQPEGDQIDASEQPALQKAA